MVFVIVAVAVPWYNIRMTDIVPRSCAFLSARRNAESGGAIDRPNVGPWYSTPVRQTESEPKGDLPPMLYAIIAAVLIAADQVVKSLVRANIPMWESIPFIPHVMDLTYVQNTGAAFNIFREHHLAAHPHLRPGGRGHCGGDGKVVRHRFGLVCLSVVLAGAVGNPHRPALLRLCHRYVPTTFISFAVFNVADICVVLGGIAFCVFFSFFYDKLEKGETPHGDSASDA